MRSSWPNKIKHKQNTSICSLQVPSNFFDNVKLLLLKLSQTAVVQEQMARSTSWGHSTCWPLETSHHTWTFGSDEPREGRWSPHFQVQQEILLDCDQSNVLLARIIFFCILLRAFSFLSVCIRDPASNWDPFNIILIVTGVEIVIGNCLPAIHKILPDFRNWEEKISNNGRWR